MDQGFHITPFFLAVCVFVSVRVSCVYKRQGKKKGKTERDRKDSMNLDS